MPAPKLDANSSLPADGFAGALAGRVWRPDQGGPSVVAIRADGVFDVSRAFPTMRDLCEAQDPAAALRAAEGEPLGPLDAILANTPPDDRDPGRPWLLAPIDLQAIKAGGGYNHSRRDRARRRRRSCAP
jgi:fumarylacetoacetate (FAA) hydrolase family protein